MLFSPINYLVVKYSLQRLKWVNRWSNNPTKSQDLLLKKLINTAKSTKYGKEYRFSKIKTYSDFQKDVPLQDYESISPYIQKIREGKQNILWPTMIKWFSKSSGTTEGRSKFIPISYEGLETNHFRGGKDILSFYINHNKESNLFSGKTLRLGGSTSINNKNHESYFGDLSAVVIENLPFWIESRSTPNQNIALLSEWEEKIDKIAHATIKENVTSFAGVPSWMLVLFKRILEITGKKNLLEVWPNLEFYAHGGVSFSPYIQEFKKLIPSEDFIYQETYNASEGFFAVQDKFPSEGMLLLTNHGIFYEFIPMEKFDGTTSKAIPLSEVELGKTYAMVISTNSGLWRYIIGDSIKFTSIKPFRIEVAGRTKHFINAFGEEVIMANAEKALKHACDISKVSDLDYSAAPVYMENDFKGAHEWVIEFSNNPDNLDVFKDSLDQMLQELNSDYAAKRHKNMVLTEPKIVVARENLFYDWLKLKGKLGGQHKVPRLSNQREVLNELLALNEE